MNIEQLSKLIEESLNGKKFALTTSTLESDTIDAIATDYLLDGVFKLTDATIASLTENSIQVKGNGVDVPFKGMAVAATFYLIAENAALSLEASGAKSWTLKDAVPSFKDTIAASLSFSLEPEAPSLFLLSDAAEFRAAGLTFEGTIDLATSTKSVSTLLGIEKEEVKGPIVLAAGGANFVSINLAGTDIRDVNLWVAEHCQVQFKIGSKSLSLPTADAALPFLELSAVIPFEDGKYEIPIAAQIVNLKSFVRFKAEISKSIKASLAMLSSLVGATDLSGLFPPSYHPAALLDFSNLYFDFDLSGRTVANVGIQVGSETRWEVLHVKKTDKRFWAENIKLNFNIRTPFKSDERTRELTLDGDLTLTPTASLEIHASYPDFEVHGKLGDQAVLSVKEFIEQFVGESDEIPEALSVSVLNFDLLAADYSFELGIVGEWDIDEVQSPLLKIQELGFALAYTPEAQNADFTGVIKISDVDVSLTANYHNEEEEKGWIFTGSTAEGQLISMGGFVNYVERTFGIGRPPKWFEKITLKELDTTLNTATKAFEFAVTGIIPLAASKSLTIDVKFNIDAEEESYRRDLSGKLQIGASIFELLLSEGGSDSNFRASWKSAAKEENLKFNEITSAFGLPQLPSIPAGFDLDLEAASLYYEFNEDEETLLIAAKSANYGKSNFVAKKIEEEWSYVFGIDVKVSIDLANLPLVGSDLQSVVGDVGLNGFKLIGAASIFDLATVKSVNTLIKAQAGAEYPTLPELKEGIEKGAYIALEVNLGKDNTQTVQLNTAKKKAETSELIRLNDSADKDDSTKWLKLQKKIGPVYFDRVGVAYNDGKVSLLLDASLAMAALKIELVKLGASNPINKFSPEFELSGLNIAYKNGPVQISAGFLKSVANDITEYSGSALISVKAIKLSAMGSYAYVENQPSLFIFALLTSPPLGGPPAFFVTGLAAGFGYNRGLKLPTVDTVSQFPLVSGFVPNQKSPFADANPNTALKVLNEKKVVPVSIGQNWVAAGVQFNSFEIVKSFALLSVAFGTKLEIGIIGMSTISSPPNMPKDEVAVAYAELALNARILPDDGLVAVEAKLTPASYVLSKSCLLTGGFAFYIWTAPHKNQGDFVVSLGGYHPNFVVPEHYPKVPRLGFNWVVSKEVTIKGGMYFALTPSCMMAGGSLEATFNSGDLKAWFMMGADFLIAWKPYFYTARMYISFGVQYTFKLDLLFTTITETLSVNLGADLQVWGPDFSGIATIHLYIISFDISFGSTANNPAKAITWLDFQKSFLPGAEKTLRNEISYGATGLPVHTDTYCYGKVVNGLVKDLSEAKKEIDWIVNRDLTSLESYSIFPIKDYNILIKGKNGTVPADQLVFTNKQELDARNKAFGVGMVNVENADFHSTHNITIDLEGNLNPKVHYEIKAILASVPKSLWEKRPAGYTVQPLLEKALIGFQITPIAPVPDESVPIELSNFEYHHQPYPHQIVAADPVFVSGPDNVDGMNEMKRTINDQVVKVVRQNIISKLKSRGINVNENVNVSNIAAHGDDFILAPPVLSYTYWEKTA